MAAGVGRLNSWCRAETSSPGKSVDVHRRCVVHRCFVRTFEEPQGLAKKIRNKGVAIEFGTISIGQRPAQEAICPTMKFARVRRACSSEQGGNTCFLSSTEIPHKAKNCGHTFLQTNDPDFPLRGVCRVAGRNIPTLDGVYPMDESS
ncbi:MAG: hypothetical protein OEY75_12790 [Hylemonella sp.]|nr:hypothetical protein [Hylemonella sp.]